MRAQVTNIRGRTILKVCDIDDDLYLIFKDGTFAILDIECGSIGISIRNKSIEEMNHQHVDMGILNKEEYKCIQDQRAKVREKREKEALRRLKRKYENAKT